MINPLTPQETLKECNLQKALQYTNQYKDWICLECGNKLGKPCVGTMTLHNGTCDYCNKETEVTSSRDFGYPDYHIVK